jgi:hypothetical protein
MIRSFRNAHESKHHCPTPSILKIIHCRKKTHCPDVGDEPKKTLILAYCRIKKTDFPCPKAKIMEFLPRVPQDPRGLATCKQASKGWMG